MPVQIGLSRLPLDNDSIVRITDAFVNIHDRLMARKPADRPDALLVFGQKDSSTVLPASSPGRAYLFSYLHPSAVASDAQKARVTETSCLAFEEEGPPGYRTLVSVLKCFTV